MSLMMRLHMDQVFRHWKQITMAREGAHLITQTYKSLGRKVHRRRSGVKRRSDSIHTRRKTPSDFALSLGRVECDQKRG